MDAGIRLTAAAQGGLGDTTGMPGGAGSVKVLESSSWGEIAQRVGQHLTPLAAKSGSSAVKAEQLAELLRLQVDVSRYHLKVEMLSKVAESAVASLRKLQQPQ